MTDRPRDLTHPEALLASFVDGAASPEERSLVEAHLVTCETCRSEVELARRGRAALRTLPDMPAPDISSAVGQTLGLGEEASLGSPAPRPRGRSGSLFWGAGAGAAAALIALGVYLGVMVSSGGGGSSPAAMAPPQPAGGAEARPQAGSDFTRARVNALADSLADERLGSKDQGAFAPSGASRAPTATSTTGSTLSGLSPVIEECLRSAGGLPHSSTVVYVAADATFQGTPAYVGAFSDAAERQLVVIVADRRTCLPLYSVAVPL